jgi:hypothetical protein
MTVTKQREEKMSEVYVVTDCDYCGEMALCVANDAGGGTCCKACAAKQAARRKAEEEG